MSYFLTLRSNYPWNDPCDAKNEKGELLFKNQCAIRLSYAMKKTGLFFLGMIVGLIISFALVYLSGTLVEYFNIQLYESESEQQRNFNIFLVISMMFSFLAGLLFVKKFLWRRILGASAIMIGATAVFYTQVAMNCRYWPSTKTRDAEKKQHKVKNFHDRLVNYNEGGVGIFIRLFAPL
ncbi:MAG: hypothetical protein L3J88_08510 [Gammaproteobacteria bacterium]|nr:hypothetical protein [Gammaproteobacteria bacterium]